MIFTKKLLACFSVLIITSPAYSSGIEHLPATLEYNLDLKIDYNTQKLYGTCEITMSNITEEPIKNVPVLLYRLLSVKSVKDGNNVPLSFGQEVVSIYNWEQIQVNFIEIALDKPLLPGEQDIIRLDYEGYLFGYSAEGWRYVKDHIARDFTLIRTDGFGYPVICNPDDRDLNYMVQQKFDYQINITVPAGMIVVTGGKLIDKTLKGDEITYTFYSKKPSYRIDIAISDYKTLEEGKNKVHYFAGDSLSARKVMNALQTSIELYTGWFGPLDNYQGFSIIEVPEGYSSQQDVAAIILSAENFRGSDDMRVIYHEIAHSWNVTSLDPQPSRFESEGYAMFLQTLLLEKLDNRKDMVSAEAQNFLNRIRNTFSENEEYQTIPIKDYGVKGMTNYSYTLGMVVFAIFYDIIGQECFNEIIGSFYLAHHTEGATLEDFIDHCKKTAPVNLEIFFNDWIYTTNGIKFVVEGKTFEELKEYYN